MLITPTLPLLLNEYHTNHQIRLNDITFDFARILGDTIKEKYETILLQVINASRELKYNDCLDDSELNWIWTSPEISSIFETSLSFIPAASSEDYIIKNEQIYYCGYVEYQLFKKNQFYVIKDALASRNKMIVGVGGMAVKIIVENYCG